MTSSADEREQAMRLIDADYVLSKIGEYADHPNEELVNILAIAFDIVCEAPTIEQPKEGEWIFVTKEQGKNQAIYRCSICGNHKYGGGRFCGMCGAKMKGAEE